MGLAVLRVLELGPFPAEPPWFERFKAECKGSGARLTEEGRLNKA